MLTEELLDEHFEPIVRKGLKLALQGNTPMLRFFLERILPQQPKDDPLEIGPLSTGTPEEMLQSQATVLAGVASGQITPTQGAQVVSLIDVTRRLFETQELTERVRAMEQLLDKGCNKAA